MAFSNQNKGHLGSRYIYYRNLSQMYLNLPFGCQIVLVQGVNSPSLRVCQWHPVWKVLVGKYSINQAYRVITYNPTYRGEIIPVNYLFPGSQGSSKVQFPEIVDYKL